MYLLFWTGICRTGKRIGRGNGYGEMSDGEMVDGEVTRYLKCRY